MSELANKDSEGIAIHRKIEGLFNIPNNLPLNQQHREIFLSCRNFPQIKSIEDNNLVVPVIHQLINQTIMDKGVKMEVEEIDYLKTKVTADIMNDYNSYTLEELRLAFHYGVRGEFGEYYGLNAVTFYGWLRSFRYDMLPPVSQKVQKLLPKHEPVAPSQEDTDKAIQTTLYDVYLKLCEAGEYEFYDIGNVVYKYLDRIGVIPFTNEEKMEFMQESRNRFGTSIVRRNSEFTKQGKDFHKVDIERAFEMLEKQSNPTFEHQVRVGAMRLALFHFLNSCAEQDIDLKQVIDDLQIEKKD